jgi:uncharacterized protein DUF7008
VIEPVRPPGVVERGRQGGDTPAQDHQAAAGVEFAADELGDVLVGEAFQADRAERGDEVVIHSVDFLKSSYWRHRGKLDVPKERFVSYPGAGRDGDPSLLIGWAGWDHRESRHRH